MRYFSRSSVFLLFFYLASLGLANADGPYHGRVVDAETKQPIEGAVVFAEWRIRSPGVVRHLAHYDAQEAFTDQQGNFVIAGIITPPKDPTAKLEEPKFIIFKPGYEAIKPRILKPTSAEVQARHNIKDNISQENGVVVVELRKLTDPKERRLNLTGFLPIPCRAGDLSQFCVPPEKYSGLIKVVNEERLIFRITATIEVKR
jgi:hypothetical protein